MSVEVSHRNSGGLQFANLCNRFYFDFSRINAAANRTLSERPNTSVEVSAFDKRRDR